MSNNNQQKKGRSLDRDNVRAEIAHLGICGLVIPNGGAFVTLLALLQALWSTSSNPHPMVSWLLWSLSIYAIGAFAGGAIYIPRYYTSLRYEQAFQANNKQKEKHSLSMKR